MTVSMANEIRCVWLDNEFMVKCFDNKFIVGIWEWVHPKTIIGDTAEGAHTLGRID